MAKESRSRASTVGLGALNIVTHPHSTQTYIDLFYQSFAAQPKGGFKLFGDYYGLVRSAFAIEKGSPENGIEGELVRFIEISPDDSWFNVEKAEVASSAERKEIHIPKHLRPKMRSARYIFFPKEHRLVFVAQHPVSEFSPSVAKTLIASFLNESKGTEFPTAVVTVEQSKQALREIFSLYELKELNIYLHTPNADTSDESDQAIMRELEQQNAGEMRVILKAQSNEGLRPSNRNKVLAETAVSNGNVEAVGLDANGARTRINTEDTPVIVRFREKLDKIDIVSWMRLKAKEVMEKVTKREEKVPEKTSA